MKTKSIEQMKSEMAQAMAELEAKKAEMAAMLKAVKEEQAKLKDQEKEAKAKMKAEEARLRAERMRAMLSGSEVKVNMTERIRQLLLQGKTTDEIQAETGYERKAILDRVWLIEKKLGIR